MKKKASILIIAGGIALAAALPPAVFYARAPVLAVADMSFIRLYGESRVRRENFRSSLKLFRPVKTVAAADDSGDDIVQFAVAEISSRPFCVIFPYRFKGAARLYQRHNPQIPVVLLEGRYLDINDPGDLQGLFVYKTDINADFYRAASAAAVLDGDKGGKIAVFIDSQLQTQCKDAFLQVFNELEKPPDLLFFTSFSEYDNIADLSCVVLTGAGFEYPGNFSGVPVVFFTWIDPSFLPDEVVLVVDDSPWVQIPQAVKMAASGSPGGEIGSNFILQNRKKFGVQALRKILKTG